MNFLCYEVVCTQAGRGAESEWDWRHRPEELIDCHSWRSRQCW